MRFCFPIDYNRDVQHLPPAEQWVERWRQGDAEAAGWLFTHYAERLVRVAEAHLSRKVAVREDGEDVVQSVFRTFLRRAADGQFRLSPSAAGELWPLLLRITVLKSRAHGRRHSAGRRNVAAEAPGAPDEWLAECATREPAPEEAAIFVDQIDSLLRDLEPTHAQVLQLRLQGHSRSDIARQLDVARQTVHRILRVLQNRLDRSLQEIVTEKM